MACNDQHSEIPLFTIQFKSFYILQDTNPQFGKKRFKTRCSSAIKNIKAEHHTPNFPPFITGENASFSSSFRKKQSQVYFFQGSFLNPENGCGVKLFCSHESERLFFGPGPGFEEPVGKPFAGRITIRWLNFFPLASIRSFEPWNRSGLHFIILSGTTARLLPESPSQASSSVSPSSSTMPPWLFFFQFSWVPISRCRSTGIDIIRILTCRCPI